MSWGGFTRSQLLQRVRFWQDAGVLADPLPSPAAELALLEALAEPEPPATLRSAAPAAPEGPPESEPGEGAPSVPLFWEEAGP